MKTARDIIQDVQAELQDVEGIRWPAAELVNALNDGQRAIVEADPLSTAAEVEFDLAPGARQTIPGAAHALLEVIRNAAGRRGAIAQCWTPPIHFGPAVPAGLTWSTSWQMRVALTPLRSIRRRSLALGCWRCCP